MPSSSPSVVLVRPRNPFNIGACARAMANFGLSDLRLVAPHPPIWAEAKRAAVEAGGLLRRARVYPDLESATADCRLVLGTTALKTRRPGRPLRVLPELPRPRGSWALVFGPEKTGLTEAHLEYCDELLNIPTDSKCPSMNLAQAVAVACYAYSISAGRRDLPKTKSRISSGELELLISRSTEALDMIAYRPSMTQAKKRARVRRLFRRRGLEKEEAGMLYEILRRISER